MSFCCCCCFNYIRMLISRGFLPVNHTRHWWISLSGMAFDADGPFLYSFLMVNILFLRSAKRFLERHLSKSISWWRWMLYFESRNKLQSSVWSCYLLCKNGEEIRMYGYSCLYIKMYLKGCRTVVSCGDR